MNDVLMCARSENLVDFAQGLCPIGFVDVSANPHYIMSFFDKSIAAGLFTGFFVSTLSFYFFAFCCGSIVRTIRS